jgi:hypothetical protein
MTFLAALTVAWNVLKKHWLKFLIGLVIIIVFFVGRGCYKSWTTPTLNQKEIEQITEGMREGNEQKVKEGLAASDARVQLGIDEVAKTDEEARQVEEAAKQNVQNYEGWTPEDLAAEAERRLQNEKNN